MSRADIVFVGAGNLATNLAKALYRNGFHILQVYSRTELSARTLAKAVQADYTTQLHELYTGASLYIVSLTDSAFVELLPEITTGKEHALWVHTAGSISMSVWEGYAKRYGVLYPLQTFSKQREVDFRNIPLFIEAINREDAEYLKSLAAILSDKVYEAYSEQRKNLHLAAVFACNFVNHLYALSASLLEKHRLSFDVLLPLIDETARKVHEQPPKDAQTGPAVRYDKNVIDKHVSMLAGEPEVQEIYRLLSESIHKNNS
ncbi:Glutamyl-tRNA reductase [termite gut metagenome]|uniref:Glutamyl-tRNA reductase n=2 Tax=termite gut metagenome TaxID=433724 RepID=A0A5J4RKT1_9ZZZZ